LKLIRFILICLGLVVLLAALLLAAALTSPVQTWLAQMMLDRQPGLQSTLGSVSAGFGKFEITDLHLEADRWALTLPSLQASLPVKSASWDGNFAIRSLVAKGWTLDLSRTPEPLGTPAAVATGPAVGPPATVQSEAEVVQKVERIFRGILDGWKLPCDLALDGADLEGDVLVAVSPDRGPVSVHVMIKGGGMAAGREGTFEFEAEAADPWLRANSVTAHGRLIMAMKSPRALRRIGVTADLSAQGGIFGAGYAVAASFAMARGPGEETYTLDLARSERHLAVVSARFSPATRRVTGDWKVDLREADVVPFVPDHPLPSISTAGEGHFEAGAAFTQMRVLGRIDTVARRLAVLVPALERVGEVTLGADFDLTCRGRTIRFEQLRISVAAARPVAVVRSLQPFEIDAGTGVLTVPDPQGDWLEATIHGLPLDWLSGRMGRLALAGGDATGQFDVRAAGGGFSLRPKTPLTATNVAVQGAGRVLGRQLDLSLSLLADFNPQGWSVQWAPLTIAAGGRRLATSEGKATRQGGADQFVSVDGKWDADLDALASHFPIPGFSRISARSVSGDFSASVGLAAEVEGKLTVVGHDPAHTVTASVTADVDFAGGVAFKVPVRFASGKNVSEMLAEGKWSGDETESRIVGKLTGDDVDLEHVRQLAAPLAAVAGLPPPWAATGTAAGTSAATDREPFWGKWAGTVTVAFDHLRTRGEIYRGVGGTLELDATSLRLERGRGGLPPHSPVELEGAIFFDAAAEHPYRLKATASVGDLDPAPWIVTAQREGNSLLEGRVSIAATLGGDGNNLGDLVRHAQEEYRLTSTNGISRFLRTSVADVFTEAPAPVISDALGTAGSMLSWLMGTKGKGLDSDEKKVSPVAESVLTFTSLISEIVYDRFNVTATRGDGGAIQLAAIEMVAPEEHLTGTGRIDGSKGSLLRDRPLDLDLKLGVRGNLADAMKKTGLLGAHKDSLGYTELAQPIHVAGSLAHLDFKDWHDVLAKAATRPSEAGK